nr:craniofacial development protein 2-like [Tanacetum cinerariifolium]
MEGLHTHENEKMKTNTLSMIEAVDSDDHLRSCPSGLGGIVGGRGNRSFGRLGGSRWIRVGNWNVVDSRSDRIMEISVVIEGETVNVISAYAPQLGLSDTDKTRFWDALDEMVWEGPTNQCMIIGGDLNGHISAAADGYTEVYGGFGFGDRNEEGCTILEFATAHDLVVANSFFKKSDAYLIAFQSGGHNTQIDYLFVRRGDLKACKDCRAFLGEACSSQHRLIIVDVLLESLRHRKEATGRPRILWKNLNGEAVETFRATISERLAVED